MTWADGKSTIVCELCGHINEPEETIWFQGEVAICRDEATCNQRESDITMTSESIKARGTFPVINLEDRNPNQYIDKARRLVLEHYNHHFLDVGEELHISQIYVTQFTKTLQNWKAMVATDVANDGMYFEVTYNGDLKETYLDVYVKASNSVIPDTGHIETTTSNLKATLDRVTHDLDL